MKIYKCPSFLFYYLCAHVKGDASRGQNRVLDTLDLELYAVVSHSMWVLGTELWSLARTAVFLITVLAASSQLFYINT